MTTYMLRAQHTVALPVDIRPSTGEVTEWLERTLNTDGVQVVRVADNILEFRSPLRPFARDGSRESLAFLGRGEIEVGESEGGPSITVRANPRLLDGMIGTAFAIVWLSAVFGWANASGLLRWGAGIGGILLGGVFIFLTWGSINTFLTYKAGILRMLRTRSYKSPDDAGAA